MLATLLSKLPFILTFWTSIILCWGIYLNISMVRDFGKHCFSNPLIATFASTVVANVVLVLYLIFEPELARSAGDAIIVIDVFYTSVLAVVSFSNTHHQPPSNLTSLSR